MHTIAVGRARQVLNAPLRKINLPPIRPFNKLANGVSHTQIDADLSKIQRLEHSAIAMGCTEIVAHKDRATTGNN